MSKKRKTRAQKIITSLRKELERQKRQAYSSQPFQQETIRKTQKTTQKTSLFYPPPKSFSKANQKHLQEKQKQLLPVTFDPNLIKVDLFKTLYLGLVFFAFIALTWWYLEMGGEKIIRGFFRL